MCMIEHGERYEVYNAREVARARRPHRCGECGREIAAGEPYRRTSGLFPGEGWCINCVCQHCTAATRWLLDNCGGYLDQSVLEDLEYHLEEEAYDWPAARKVAMARVVVGMRRGWARRNGGPMPLPRAIPDYVEGEA